MTSDIQEILSTTPKKERWEKAICQFRNIIPSPKFAAERDRYVLYVFPGCPWAQRAMIARNIKGLEDIIQLVQLDSVDPVRGWCFTGRLADCDPIYGTKYLQDLYLMADPNYNGRLMIPVLWDKKYETIVNNASSEIVRIFNTAFDEFLPSQIDDPIDLYPTSLQSSIDELNAWVYAHINNGVYKAGFAKTQGAYDEAIELLFSSLGRLEAHLSLPQHQPYLFGEKVTEADVMLFPTIIRFDVAYHTLFKCNMKMIRHDYPKLHDWLRRLYWDEGKLKAFGETTDFFFIKHAYTYVATRGGIVPAGPHPNVLPL